MEIIDRETAFRFGKVRYFTGKRCTKGHLSERYVSTGGCLACLRPGSNAEFEKVVLRVHREDMRVLKDMADALKQARALEIGDLPAPVRDPGERLSREEREKNWARALLKSGDKWRPMPPAPWDLDYVAPTPPATP